MPAGNTPIPVTSYARLMTDPRALERASVESTLGQQQGGAVELVMRLRDCHPVHGKFMAAHAFVLFTVKMRADKMLQETDQERHELAFAVAVTRLCKTASWAQVSARPVAFWGNLRNFGHELLNCSIWNTLRDRDEPIVVMMSKGLPKRCQIREMGHISNRKFSADQVFEGVFASWIECSLLGLYEHSRARLSARRVLEFFDILRDVGPLFFRWLVKRQELLGIFASRDYLVQLVPNQPALLAAIALTFAWEAFADISSRAMDCTREQIEQHGWGILFVDWPFASPADVTASVTRGPGRKAKVKAPRTAAMREPLDPEEAKRVSDLVGYWTRATLDPSRGAAPVVDFFRQLQPWWSQVSRIVDEKKRGESSAAKKDYNDFPRSFCRLAQLFEPGMQADRAKKLLRAWRTEEDALKKQRSGPVFDLPCLAAAQKEMENHFYRHAPTTFLELVQQIKGKVEPLFTPHADMKLAESDLTEFRVTKAHYSHMSALVNASDPADESRVLERLVDYGASPVALERIFDIKNGHERHGEGKKRTTTNLTQLRGHAPYTYALLHAFAYLWTRHCKFGIHELPAQCLINQTRAIRARLGLSDKDTIPESSVYMLVCTMCDRVYSLCNDFSKKAKRVDPDFVFGYERLTMDPVTGELFCNRKAITTHNDFRRFHLTKIRILNRVVMFRGNEFLLCPQPKCGCLFQYDQDATRYNQYGFMCPLH